MKHEKSKPAYHDKKSPKEIESLDDLTSVEGETFIDKENRIDKEVLQLLALRTAYIESGVDKTGTESITVRRKNDNKIIFYTIFPWEIEEVKKVYKLANISK